MRGFSLLGEIGVGLSQLFENNFGNNRYLLEYGNYSSLIGLQTLQWSIRSTVSIEAQYMCLVGKHGYKYKIKLSRLYVR